MARPAVLAVKIVTDASDARRDLDQTADSLKDVDKAARDVSGGIDTAGGATQKAAGGIRDLMGSLEGTRFAAFGDTVAKSSTYFEAAAGASDLYSAAASSAGGVTKVWTIIQGAFNAVMALNPVALVVIAIVALIAVIIVAYKNCETFRKIVDAAFKIALSVIKTVYNWVKNNWPLLLAILTGPIGLAVLAIKTHFDTIKAVIKYIIDMIKLTLVGAFNILKSTANTVLDAMMTPIRAVRDGFKWIIDKVKSLIDWIGKIKIPSVPDWVPIIGKSAPASAGMVAGTRTGMPVARTGGATRTSTGGGGVVIHLSVPATANPVETGRQIVSMIRRFERAAGPAWRT